MTYNFESIQKTVVTQMDERRVIISGSTTIEGVWHRIENRYIRCNPSLNSRAWGVTPKKSICELCFPNGIENKQLTLF